jgi:hypothetical protein
MAAFDDFADGVFYGSVDLNPALSNATYSALLSAAAIDSMNSSDALWGMGGNLTTLDNDFANSTEFISIFGPNEDDPASTQLILTIEIPAPGVLALLGAVGLCGRGRCRT